MRRLKGREDFKLTVKDVSLLQLLSGGSLAESPEGEGKKINKSKTIFKHFFITISRTKI